MVPCFVLHFDGTKKMVGRAAAASKLAALSSMKISDVPDEEVRLLNQFKFLLSDAAIKTREPVQRPQGGECRSCGGPGRGQH